MLKLIRNAMNTVTQGIPQATYNVDPGGNVIVNRTIRAKYHPGWKRNLDGINEVVIHGTAGGSSIDALIDWMEKDGRPAEYKRGEALFHYAIGRDGRIVEVINPENGVYHSCAGRYDILHTIGIELCNPKSDNSAPYSAQQYAALWDLIFAILFERFPITRIVGHEYNYLKFSGKRKPCPGAGFSWLSLEDEMRRRGMRWDNIPGIFAYENIKLKEV